MGKVGTYSIRIMRSCVFIKVLLIGFAKIAYMPYINFYLENISDKDNEIHLLYWNRDLKNEIPLKYNIVLHEFRSNQRDETAKIRKIKNFVLYRNYAKRLIKNERYDLIIVLTTIPGILLYKTLIRNNIKYIFDYRDVTHENIGLYKKRLHKLAERSLVTFISSDAFRKYLPKIEKIYTTHNITNDMLQYRNIGYKAQARQKPIRIRYWGLIRHEKVNKAIIERIGNDDRFELHYHGREQETALNLKEYCKTNHINNVFFHGEYKPIEKYEFAKETDIIHNIYENDTSTRNAVGNKYYDGIFFGIPQLCMDGSFMAENATKADVGFACNPFDNDFAGKIFRYYNTIEFQEFQRNCEIETERIYNEFRASGEIIRRILTRGSV